MKPTFPLGLAHGRRNTAEIETEAFFSVERVISSRPVAFCRLNPTVSAEPWLFSAFHQRRDAAWLHHLFAILEEAMVRSHFDVVLPQMRKPFALSNASLLCPAG